MSQKAKNLIFRIKKELSIKKDKDLCQLLDIKHNTLSTWKKRDTVDFNKILELCETHNLDLNYIFFEEEQDGETESTMVGKTTPIKEIIPKHQVSVDLLMSSKLVTTNRNIAIFLDHSQKLCVN